MDTNISMTHNLFHDFMSFIHELPHEGISTLSQRWGLMVK
jgi:hypothetical protein